MDFSKIKIDIKYVVTLVVCIIGGVANYYRTNAIVANKDAERDKEIAIRFQKIEDKNDKQDIYINYHEELLKKHETQININTETSKGNAFMIANILKSQK